MYQRQHSVVKLTKFFVTKQTNKHMYQHQHSVVKLTKFFVTKQTNKHTKNKHMYFK